MTGRRAACGARACSAPRQQRRPKHASLDDMHVGAFMSALVFKMSHPLFSHPLGEIGRQPACVGARIHPPTRVPALWGRRGGGKSAGWDILKTRRAILGALTCGVNGRHCPCPPHVGREAVAVHLFRAARPASGRERPQAHRPSKEAVCSARSARLSVIILNVKDAHLRGGKGDLLLPNADTVTRAARECAALYPQLCIYCHHRDNQKRRLVVMPARWPLTFRCFIQFLRVGPCAKHCSSLWALALGLGSRKPLGRGPRPVQVAPANYPTTVVAHARARAYTNTHAHTHTRTHAHTQTRAHSKCQSWKRQQDTYR